MLRRMEWDDVRMLLALLRANNLHDAGARLGIDPSTVSRRLAALEHRLEQRLFARTRDGLRPTAAAERMRPYAETMEADAAACIRASAAQETRTSGVVRLATTEAFARILVSEGLLDVRREHPDLVVELLGGNRPVDLARGEADIAVRLAALKQPSLRVRCVATMGIALFAAPAYLRTRGTVRSAAALREHDLLLPTGELARLPEAQWIAARRAHVVFRSNSMPALIAAAIAGQGLVPLPIGWGDAEPALERSLTLETIPKRKVWLVTHDVAGPAVAVIANQIASIFERMLAR